MEVTKISILDRVGMGLSLLCAFHCAVTPVVLVFLPFMARYYLVHPNVHLILALLVAPVGALAFWGGYRHHRSKLVLGLGLLGLVIVAGIPVFAHGALGRWEAFWMIGGGALLITAHWMNRKKCACVLHHH